MCRSPGGDVVEVTVGEEFRAESNMIASASQEWCGTVSGWLMRIVTTLSIGGVLVLFASVRQFVDVIQISFPVPLGWECRS